MLYRHMFYVKIWRKVLAFFLTLTSPLPEKRKEKNALLNAKLVLPTRKPYIWPIFVLKVP